MSNATNFSIIADESLFALSYRFFSMPTLVWRYENGSFKLADFNEAAYELSENRFVLSKSPKDVFDSDIIDIILTQCVETRMRIQYEMSTPIFSKQETFYLIICKFINSNLVTMHIEDISLYRLYETEIIKAKNQLDILIEECNKAINSDIGKQYEIETAFQKKQTQLVHTARLASLGEMTSGVSYEISQPLSIIKAKAELLKMLINKGEDINDRLKNDLNTIIEEVDRAASIIEHMRSYARNKDVWKTVNIVDTINNSLLFFKAQFRYRGIDLQTDFQNDIPTLNINPQLFEQIVVNLLLNSQYAVEQRFEDLRIRNRRRRPNNNSYQKQIIMKAYHNPESKKVVFEVIDNGIGMYETERIKCTEPFFTTKNNNIGLGLTIVLEIVQKLNGTLEINSIKDKETCVRISL